MFEEAQGRVKEEKAADYRGLVILAECDLQNDRGFEKVWCVFFRATRPRCPTFCM
jgi:hypothetical protein